MRNGRAVKSGFSLILPVLCIMGTPLVLDDDVRASTYHTASEVTQKNTETLAHQHFGTRLTRTQKNADARRRLNRSRRYLASASEHRRHHYRRPRRNYNIRGVIQCVAYANAQSNVVIHANARDWWSRARGVYARGREPEPGSVLNFRGVSKMPLGHVAVVRDIIDNRTITVDHSHWGQPGPRYDVSVIDVSPRNNWSAVRVALNHEPQLYGSVYPTYGFIYPRPYYRPHTRHRFAASHHNRQLRTAQLIDGD